MKQRSTFWVSRRLELLLAIVILTSVVFRARWLDAPFHFDAEGTGAAFGVMARGILRFGWAETNGMPVLNVSDNQGTAPLVFYPSHPPMVTWLIAATYAVAGVGEWQTRLPTALATLAMILAIYVTLKRLSGPRAGIIAAALYATIPMVLYYGGMPEVVSVPMVLFATLTIAAYVDFVRERSGGAMTRMVIWFTLAAWSDWPAFLLIPLLAAHHAATQPWRAWMPVVWFGVLGVVTFASLYTYVVFGADESWDWMAERLRTRTGVGGGRAFTMETWLQVALLFNVTRHTWPMLVLPVLWIITTMRRWKNPAPATTFCRLLLAWSALHVLVGREGVYVHEWWWTPLTPGLAVAAALLLDQLLVVSGAWSTQSERDHDPVSDEKTAVSRAGAFKLAAAAVTCGIVAFAAWNLGSVWREFARAAEIEPYTSLELAAAIRAGAPNADDIVAIADSKVAPQIFFYGDRSLRPDVWSADDLARRMNDEYVDLMYYFRQPWEGGSPVSLVFPLVLKPKMEEFLAELEQRHPVVPLPPEIDAKFKVFDLRQTRETVPLLR